MMTPRTEADRRRWPIGHHPRPRLPVRDRRRPHL